MCMQWIQGSCVYVVNRRIVYVEGSCVYVVDRGVCSV